MFKSAVRRIKTRWLGSVGLTSCLVWQACSGKNFSSDKSADTGGTGASGSNGESASGGEAGGGTDGVGTGNRDTGGRSGSGAGGTTDPGEGGEDAGGTRATGGAGVGGMPSGGTDSAGAGDAPGGGTGGKGGSAGSNSMGGMNQGGGGTTQGGSAGMGGASGTGGTIVTARCAPDTVIDDMEDGNDLLCSNAGRSGDWWITKGPVTTSSVTPAAGSDFQAFPLGTHARAGSNYGMRMAGTGFSNTSTDDYALLGFNPVNNDVPYDASRYAGISFWAKSTLGSVRIRLSFAVPGTTPPENGGTCMSLCYDYHHKDVTFGTGWQPFVVPFTELNQEGWGPAPRDLTRLLYVLFSYNPPNPANFEILVDDLAFY